MTRRPVLLRIAKTTIQIRDVRVEWVDFAKGLGIFLFVFGHTLQRVPTGGGR